MLARYCINDNFLMFYFKFIHPIKAEIEHGDFNAAPTKTINTESYRKWQGYAFERFCRLNHRFLAKILGFSDVRYKSGTYYNKETEKQKPGYQIDLLFAREDKVFTICEIKYVQTKILPSIIDEFEMKLLLFANPKQFTIKKVLISIYGPSESLKQRAYFDRFIMLSDFFES